MPEDIETIDDGNSFDPQIVIDGDNNATVVWTSSDGTRFNIWANNWSQAAGWGSQETRSIRKLRSTAWAM